MKNIYLIVFISICGLANAQIVNIPDANFKAALLIPSAGIDTNNDGEIQVSEAEATSKINAWDFNIVSLEGIEYFINITELFVDKNQIEVLDVSNNTKLEVMFCDENLIITIDLSNNPNLSWIEVGYNPLLTLNVSANPNLEILGAYNCELTELDVANNPMLQILDIDHNKIKTLDISYNPELLHLYAYENNLISLNLKSGNNQLLDSMHVYGNPELTCIQVDNLNDATSRICDLPNNGWCKDETASYSVDCELGIEDFTSADFKLFPIPTGNILNIESQENIENVKIYSTQGVLVKEVSSENIDVSGLNVGMYFVQITFDGKRITKKFIKL